MGVEIERKFLLANADWRAQAQAGTSYEQGYLRKGDTTVRVRIAGDRAFLTIKGPSSGCRRLEYEYPVPESDAREILDSLCVGPIIQKTRYLVSAHGKTWEIDEFHGDNAGLLLAEIELEAEDETISLPPWIGREVTDDPRYYNVNLMDNPFTQWSETP